MKWAIAVLLALILVVLCGIYWNQARERDERLRREAAVELARQKVQAEIEESRRRKKEAAQQAAEAEKELDKKLKETFWY
jgi:type VI protein secretion system component VasK